ncbi:hypothetical protein KDL01_03625 [Actinospica durhamensis]|uniref:Uncharacterized protein n=1 Tax=Actinospica durhamensis TaxID=1508375 RepID=A0A941IRI7_9ACTN|nr:hypothetical protein [Actinospica durhamensis]MBR7832331.1 hypothetical protein [Actinospica durhamensis]
MRIDGKGFLATLGVCTLVLAVLTVWLWPRLAGSGAKALAGRVGLLLGTQLSLAATFLFAVNALGGFYTSWGQLFGTASAKYTIVNRGASDAAKADARALTGASARTGGGGSGGGRGSGRGGPGSGSGGLAATKSFIAAELGGVRSGLSASLQIYPPTDYASRAEAHRHYPVEVVNLTGGSPSLASAIYQQVANTYQVMVVVVTGTSDAAPASPTATVSTASAGSTASTSSTASTAPTGSTGSASLLTIPGVNVPHGEQGQLFWSQDLQGALRAHYRVDASAPDWGMAGVGQDGTAAVNLAVQDPSHYGLAAAGGDWTHTAASESWPGIDTYLASVPMPAVALLYDPTVGDVPARIQASSGALRITRHSGLTLVDELDWLGRSLEANADVRV